MNCPTACVKAIPKRDLARITAKRYTEKPIGKADPRPMETSTPWRCSATVVLFPRSSA